MELGMTYLRLAILLPVLAVFATGCTINHPVADDYGQYLENNLGAITLPKTELRADYVIDHDTRNHRYEFRATTAGAANLWIVEFGKILDETLKSADVQQAFAGLRERQGEQAGNENLITFKLEKYEYKDFRAHISLAVLLTRNGDRVLDKTYHAEGRSQGGKVLWGGVWAMKNAVHQSTKFALDEILGDFIEDVNTETAARQADAAPLVVRAVAATRG